MIFVGNFFYYVSAGMGSPISILCINKTDTSSYARREVFIGDLNLLSYCIVRYHKNGSHVRHERHLKGCLHRIKTFVAVFYEIFPNL